MSHEPNWDEDKHIKLQPGNIEKQLIARKANNPSTSNISPSLIQSLTNKMKNRGMSDVAIKLALKKV